MKAEEFLKRGDKFSLEFNMRRACSLIEPFSFKNEDLIEFAEAYLKHKVEAIIKECEEAQETLKEAAIINYKELYEGEPLTQDIPIDAFKQGAKWFKNKLLKQ